MAADILIAGAGIGGLTTALSLHQAGFSVRIFEAVPTLAPLGVGLNLLPHAVREMDELGLLPALDAVGVRCEKLAYFTKRGEAIWDEPRGTAAGYHWPQISIHRGELQLLLYRAVLECLGPDRVHFGHRLCDWEPQGQGVRAWFEARDSGQRRAADGQLLIGADGIHSALRRSLFPAEGLPCWNGTLLWRGVAIAAPMFDGHTMIMAGHADQKFVCYPIQRAPLGVAADQQLLNFVAELRFAPGALPERESWNKAGVLADFLPQFAQWQFPWLDVPALIQAADATWVYPLVDRDPLPAWSHGPVTLLGDAAHPMYPIGSNGASQAILDARVLTGCLLHYRQDPQQGLARYDAIRREATSAIVLANREQGPEAAMQLVETRAPDGFTNLDAVISVEERRAIAERYKQIAGFSRNELNSRQSLAAPTA